MRKMLHGSGMGMDLTLTYEPEGCGGMKELKSKYLHWLKCQCVVVCVAIALASYLRTSIVRVTDIVITLA